MNGRKRKLTDEQLAIVRSWKPLHGLAKEFGVSPRTIRWARLNTYKSERLKRR